MQMMNISAVIVANLCVSYIMIGQLEAVCLLSLI